ncbi:tRNA (adenosine(37)-N6)-threonylcarbamoyltransferase complex ATPase subunit type 1 TsaE [Mycoplasma iguanae]|uniref:tRNA threonylcarbamoyladenosine biosynthesis protein TsaE n=1 Tax=Mycoplasma iguanae TaxID=292461 RepID=A0ABY5R890_9MOLU|nr:tRNA (adenosine(37)-N6)-threonylcarbamoyltransferase complex ATPase subunit type 1 TsaE [Mycoplasma iguanae]UVD81726.1 tRNA (adenosine(37)-N6)-threonylcarbamoyltransferase complex ATPase subunit type 1 TsaE [Mycoplasma iguanae]
MKIKTTSIDQLEFVVSSILSLIKKNKYILLNGEMGSGKTTLVKLISQKLGEKSIVNSPTFNIMKVYNEFVHIDAYKITGNLEEYEDFFEDKIVFIEWAKNLVLDYNQFLTIDIELIDENTRIYTIEEHNN